MRPLIFSPSSSLYGASRAILFGAVGILKRGHQPTLAIGSGPLRGLADSQRIRVADTSSKYWLGNEGGWLRGVRRQARNRRLAREFAVQCAGKGYDIVHSNTLNSPFGGILASELNLPHLWQMHEFLGATEGSHFLLGPANAARFIERSTDLIVVNSRFTEERSRSYCPADRVRVIYYGCLDEDAVRKAPPVRPPIDPARTVQLVLVGSLQTRKGQSDAILALKDLAAAGIDARLTLVGDGGKEDVKALKRLALDSGVASRITWTGFVDNPGEFYDRADIALMCSRNEPFGLVTVESMSRGIVTVGAASGGILEVIMDEINGLLYEPGQPEQLAKQLRRIIENNELRGKLAASAYFDVYSRFGFNRYAHDLENAYLEAIDHFPRRSRESPRGMRRG